jgi:beta-glucosidase
MTWDKDLFYQQYKALGAEFRGKGINLMKGPVSEPLGRTPWGGRNGESFGPDPYLNGIALARSIEGAGAAGVISCTKHFLLNEQENNRTVYSTPGESVATTVAYSSQVDDKTLHETYMWPFYDGVKSGMGAVMCALNRVNLTYACENQDLLAGQLKTELGFPGLVLGDVGGQKTSFGSANAGMDFGDAQYWSNDTIMAGLKNGSLTEARLNDMAGMLIKEILNPLHC